MVARRRRIAVVAVFVAGALLGASCGPKVDCDELRSRLKKCTKDLVWAVKPQAKAQVAKAGPKGARELDRVIADLRKRLDADVYKPCEAHRGRAKDAKQINKCLAAKSCEAFAACFAKFLKEGG